MHTKKIIGIHKLQCQKIMKYFMCLVTFKYTEISKHDSKTYFGKCHVIFKKLKTTFSSIKLKYNF